MLTSRFRDTTGILHLLLQHEQFFNGPRRDVSMAASHHDAYVPKTKGLTFKSPGIVLNRANKMSIVCISALIISIFLAVAFSKRFRHPVETTRNRLMGADNAHTMEEGLHLITGVPSMKQRNKSRGSAEDDAIRRFEQRHESLEGRTQTFFNPHPTEPLASVQSRSGKHSSWRRAR